MATRRSINFVGAMHELRSQRRRAPVPFIVAGRFDRAAIMREAIRLARQLRSPGLTWARKLSISLKTAWQKARTASVARLAA